MLPKTNSETPMSNVSSPLISIVMNCYNSSLYLKEAIDSVIQQTYTNWEIIFWDNQSTDDSATIFKQYQDSRLKYFYAPEHTSLSRARNLAIAQTQGTFVAFLDCDDLWETKKLEEQIAATRNPLVGIIYSPFEVITNTDDRKKSQLSKSYNALRYSAHGPLNLYNRLLFRNYIIFSSVLISKNVLLSAGGINEDLHQNEDYELLLKCSLQSLFVCTSTCLVKYRVHSTNTSHANHERNFIENRLIYASLPQSILLKRAIKRNELRYALFTIRHTNDKQKGFKLLKQNFSIILLVDLFSTKLRDLCLQ